MKIAEHVAMLEISANIMGAASTIHPALLSDGDNLILVDTGFPGQLDAVREAIAQEGETFDRLNGIILTHQDIDHIGNLASICEALPGKVTVFAHAVEKPFITGEKTPLKLAQLEANYQALPEQMKAIYQKLKAGFQSSFANVQSTLSDGQMLPYCGGIEIIATPGHTTGHICLYLRESKTLIAGDAVAVENGSLVATPASLNYHENEYRESLKKLAGYEVNRVLCYHGGLYQGDFTSLVAKLPPE